MKTKSIFFVCGLMSIIGAGAAPATALAPGVFESALPISQRYQHRLAEGVAASA